MASGTVVLDHPVPSAFSTDRQIESDTGIRPSWSPEAFDDSANDIRQSINRLQANVFLPHQDEIRGFVYNDKTGELDEVR